MLFRITYIRNGSPHGVTFHGADFVEALQFADLWQYMTRCIVLTIKPIQSRGLK